jgi:molybdate transport system substrate-binding protein
MLVEESIEFFPIMHLSRKSAATCSSLGLLSSFAVNCTYLILLVFLSSRFAGAQEISIAAASDLEFVFKEVTFRFANQTGNRVQVSFGSSGNFFSVIENGAPFDLFFSADIEYPQKLESGGFAEPETLYQYARGRIVLWVANESGLDISQGLKILLDSRVKKVAIANPTHAPYGRAAVAALKNAGIYEKISEKLVFGENISQTANFVVTGNADAGIIALSLALSPAMKSKGRYFLILPESYPPLEQAGVILKSSSKKELAKCFMEFLHDPEIVELMKQYGFELPNSVAKMSIAPQKITNGDKSLNKRCSCCRR